MNKIKHTQNKFLAERQERFSHEMDFVDFCIEGLEALKAHGCEKARLATWSDIPGSEWETKEGIVKFDDQGIAI